MFLALCNPAEPVWYLYAGRALSSAYGWCFGAQGRSGGCGEALGWGSSHLYGLQQYGPAALLLLLLFRFDFFIMLRWLGDGGSGGDAGGLRRDCHASSAAPCAGPAENRDVGAVSSFGGELIEQVRARQHDFNNQMMAVAAAVSAAHDLQEAQEAVTSLLQHVRLDGADKELLNDSK